MKCTFDRVDRIDPNRLCVRNLVVVFDDKTTSDTQDLYIHGDKSMTDVTDAAGRPSKVPVAEALWSVDHEDYVAAQIEAHAALLERNRNVTPPPFADGAELVF